MASDIPVEPIGPSIFPNADPQDSAVTNVGVTNVEVTDVEPAEKRGQTVDVADDEPGSKRVKLEEAAEPAEPAKSERIKGVAPIRSEFLVHQPGARHGGESAAVDDDAAEAAPRVDSRDRRGGRKEKNRGQNKGRDFGMSRDKRGLCQSRVNAPEFSPEVCPFGDGCKFEHDLRTYLQDHKREDLATFGGKCPVWESTGRCGMGWKCRFVSSHMRERDAEDGRKELVLLGNLRNGGSGDVQSSATQDTDVVNVISAQDKIDLTKRKTMTAKAEAYTKWLDKAGQEANARSRSKMQPTDAEGTTVDMENGSAADAQDMRAQYAEPPFLPSEKRRIYFGAETPVLAPLTTQGNLPFRRLCVSMGAQITYSEMAMSFPLIQGQKSEWALMKAHRSETSPPRFRPSSVVAEYDNAKDFRFGAQIAGNRPDQTLKATEILTRLCPHLRVIDLNCGCPIDLVWRQGAGSALLDSQAKLEKMLRGMNAVSEAIPITAKIRMGTKDGRPTALKLINRLVYGAGDPSDDHGDPCGIAALTLHGRSRQQRYAKSANWEYISECAALIKRHGEQGHALADTIREAEARHQPAQSKVYFVGNGDCFSHVDYDAHIRHAGVDSVMIARGALIKPWIFEEIEKRQYLDKSATERLAMVEQFVRHGLEAWGSDEMGVGTTRRFLLEWLSFAYRYVPVGIMEHLPPSLQDRPPAWRGRNELEGLLGSDDYRDWIKISEMFLGPAHQDFRFQPKHKSNSYDIEAEG